MVGVVQPLLLLLHYCLLVLEIHHSLVDLLQLVVLVHQHRLLLYPLTVQLVAPVLEILALAQQVDQLVFFWVLALVVCLAHQFVVQFVESAHLVLFFLVDVVALFDLYLVGDDQILLVVLFSESLILLLTQQFYLTLGVQLVNSDSGDLIHNIFQLHLFLLNVVSDLSGLLQHVRRSLLDGRVLTLLVDQTFIEPFCLCVQLHDVRFHLIHGILHGLLLLTGHLYVLLGV